MKSKYSKLKKPIIRWSAGLIILFTFKLISGYLQPPSSMPPFESEMFMELPIEIGVRKNYATTKYPSSSPSAVNMDQKYEKVANINSSSQQFEEDEKQLKHHIVSLNGLVQFEHSTGNKGFRRLHQIIGVPPKNFDKLYEQLIAIGKVSSKEISKKDKTNEYNELKAQRASLNKTKESLLKLKEKSGEINEYMLLENRILEIEQQLQGLGVSLGSFDSENEFCTIKFELSERQPKQLNHLQIIKNAMEWSIITYLKLMVVLTFIGVVSYLMVLIIERIKNNI
nr:DUF4349 domain-containing protein [Allomuricauda sp.]